MSLFLTDKQIIHREYLKSPVWNDKRQQALAYYGCICNRCKEYGSDVHHKTYERTGGNELMSDLEVLCRECHESHHRIEKATRKTKNKKNNSINRTALANFLTVNQRILLQKEFNMIWGGIYTAIITNSIPKITERALQLSGKTRAYLPKKFGCRKPIKKQKRRKF